MKNDIESIIEAVAPGARLVRSRPLAGGVSSDVVAIDLAFPDGRADHLVVRHRSDDVARGARRTIALEYQLMVALHARGIPVPRPRRLVSPDTMVMDFVDGTTDLPPGAEARMADALARIHAQPGGDFSFLPQREDPRPWLLDQPLDARLAALVAATRLSPEPPRLLHGDFWPNNLLWSHGHHAAILDWEDAATGDPLSDLASARLELDIAAGPQASTRFTAHYLTTTGRDTQRLALWDLYVSMTALATMDQWGLPPDELAHRRATTARFRDRATAALLASPPR